MSQTVTYQGQTHVFPDDFTDQDISDALTSFEADTHRSPMPQPTPVPPWLNALASGTRFIPSIAGAMGGIAGAPIGASIPAAALGGTLGEAVRQNVMGETPDYGKVATQGAIQGVSEGAGRLLAAGAARLAPPLMRAAGVPGAAVGEALSKSPQALAHAADVTDALADVQTAFGHPDAAATRELADNLLAARDAAQAASSKVIPNISPRYEALAAIFNPHRIPAVATELAARAAFSSPALRYYLARGLASQGGRMAISQLPRGGAALWQMLNAAPADATRR